MRSFLPTLSCVILLATAMAARATIISGTIKDTSGATVPRARIEIQIESAAVEKAVLTSDSQGHFESADLPPGTYSLHIAADGFEPLAERVAVGSSAVNLSFSLTVLAARQEITVTGKAAQFANTEPLYRQLRTLGLGTAMPVENFDFDYDVAKFHLTEGTLTWFAPVNGAVTGAIFIGKGHFTLKPALAIDRTELARRINAPQAEEDFTQVVFRFTSDGAQKLVPASKSQIAAPQAAAEALRQWHEEVRRRRETFEGLSDSLVSGSDMENVDAELLTALYNPDHPSFFSAYIHGSKHKDLRFRFRARGGAIPQLGSPEEVALINHAPGAADDGIWYLAHRMSEYSAHTASSLEERRLVSGHQFKIETAMGANGRLTSVATVRFSAVVAGERVVRFDLLPNLRVSRVTGADGKDLYFIQENQKADGSFYVILPDRLASGSETSVTVEYAGDKVLSQAGSGSFYVQAREAWYPNLNSFSERALYDLTYKVPKRFKVISVGTLDKEWTEDKYAASHWTTPKPVVVAGFNFGDYHKAEMTDDITHYHLSGYYLSELPDNLAKYRSILGSMAPGAMTKYALDQTRAQLQLCTYYFGHTSFEGINITEQPDFNFGQSWPNLVYLPISAYIDSTQRWMMFGRINNSLTSFVQEVTPHEVAHQWWGHTVNWASYHDQWLSEGFAEFSAGLFLQQAVGKNWQKDYIEFWDRLRHQILEKNNYGVAPNDAGPIWLGQRLISPRSGDAYRNVTYPKGAYILSMIRSLLYNNQDHDKAFIAMMHDFVESHRDMPASTETFKAVLEKHITKTIDLQQNGTLDWFFNEWVYGTDVPRYQFDYQLSPGANGKTKLHLSITQSEVGPSFAMFVPIYADFGEGVVRLGQLPVVGSSTKAYDIELPKQPKKVMLNAYKEILER